MARSELPKSITIFAERLPVVDGQLHICTCAGIGDLLWTWAKWWKVAEDRGLMLWFPDDEPHRAGPLAQMLGVKYSYMPRLTTDDVWKYQDDYGDPEIPDSGGVLVVSPNRCLEAGKRIERWYPDLPFKNPAEIIRERTLASSYKLEAGNPKYVIVSIGERGYMGGQMMPGQWARTLQVIEETVAPVLLIASERSSEFVRSVLKLFDPILEPAFNVPLAELSPVIDRAQAVVGTASGITILSTYLGKPTLHCYPRWLRAMPGTWAQDGAVEDACFVDDAENAVRDGFLSEIMGRVA